MRNLCLLFGILCAVAFLTLVAGCGGGSGSPGGESGGGASEETAAKPESKAEEKTRQEIQKIVDAKLPDFGLSSDQVACVDENIAVMTSKEMTAGVIRPSGAETAEREEETAENYLGPLANGCL
jgi:hypothetical protein